MMSLPIIWQRLVSSDGITCGRCHATHQQMQQDVRKIKEALRPLSIEPTLEIRAIDLKSFAANPSESTFTHRFSTRHASRETEPNQNDTLRLRRLRASASRSVAACLAATVGELGQSRGQGLKDLRVH